MQSYLRRGRADKAPNLNLFITRATWEEEELESEEEQQEEEWLDRIQDVIAGVWIRKWKGLANRAIKEELGAKVSRVIANQRF